MNYNRRAKALLMGVFAATLWASAQQFTNVGGNGWWRTNPTTPNIGRGVAIGNLTATPYPAAFQIHGELMPAGNNTPEVFRTNAPTTGNTFWRMFQGGTTAGFERGQLFADPNHQSGYYQFNINAPTGHLQLLTQNVLRARLNGSVTGGSVGPFNGINRAGFLMLSGVPDAFAGTGSQAPFTRMHLIDEETGFVNPIVYAQTQGFRPWQRNGITFTGNSDQSYIGQKYAGNDNTDFVIQWSDNPNGSPWGVDRMKFVFTTQYNAGQSRGAASTNGLEAIRLWPRNNFDVNMGIGDFFAGNQLTPTVVVDPTERVDILNGRLRIRQLPDDSAAVDSFFVMVVDRTTLTPGNQERGVVKWVDPSVFGGGGADCDWTVENDGVSGPGVSHNVYTAVGVDDDCPDDDDRVGIGTATPEAKLHVKKAVVIEPGNDRAALFHNPNGAFTSVGGEGMADGGVNNIGLRGIAENSSRLYGVWGIARNGGGGAVGVRAEAYASAAPTAVEGTAWGGATAKAFQGVASNASNVNHAGDFSALGGQETRGVTATGQGGSSANYGIWANANGANPWAGWFVGNVNITNSLTVNSVIYPSDAALKTDVADAAACLPVIAQLSPKSYSFTSAATDALNVDHEPHIGLSPKSLSR